MGIVNLETGGGFDPSPGLLANPPSTLEIIGWIAVISLVILAYLIGFLVFGGISVQIVLWAWRSAGAQAKIIAVGMMLATGGMLFWLRSTHRVLYGSLEIAFAIYSSWLSLGPGLDIQIAGISVVVASIYLVVRGLDNITAGMTKSNTERRATRTAGGET